MIDFGRHLQKKCLKIEVGEIQTNLNIVLAKIGDDHLTLSFEKLNKNRGKHAGK